MDNHQGAGCNILIPRPRGGGGRCACRSRRCWRVQHRHQHLSQRAAQPPVWWSRPAAREVHPSPARWLPAPRGDPSLYLAMETLAQPQGPEAASWARAKSQLRQGDRQGPDEGRMSKMGISPTELLAAQISNPSASTRRFSTVFHRHREQRGRHPACSRSPRANGTAPRPAFGGDRCCQHARHWRRVRAFAPAARAHVDAGDHRQAAARNPRQQLNTYKEYAALIKRPGPLARRCAGCSVQIADQRTPVPLEEVGPAKDRQALRHRRHVAGLDLH